MSTVLDKLRYKAGMRVYVVGAPAGFEVEMGRLPKGIERARTLSGKVDLVHAFFTRKSDFDKEAASFGKALGPSGILWISYPKGKGLGTDLNRDVLREAGAKKGLEAVAQVAIDEVWSALRFKVASRADG
jgi:hypothetical protein